MSLDGSPPLAATAVPPEDRRLKLIGLALAGLSMPGFYRLSEHPFTAWPPSGDTLWRFGLIGAFGANLVVIGLLVLSAGFGKSRSLLGDVMAAAQPAPSGNRFTALFWTDPRRRLGAIVCFAADGTAHAESVRSWSMAWQDIPVMMMARPSAGPLRQTFRRVFEHLKLGRNEPVHGRSRALAIALAFFAGGVGSHWVYLGRRRRRGLAYLLFFVLTVPIFLAWADALRMILMDRAEFAERFA